MPTLPFASTVRPDPAVELDWIRAMMPLVTALVLATYSSPLVELPEAYDEVKDRSEPVVIPSAVMVIGFWVVAVDQFQACAKLSESMELVLVAARILFNLTLPAGNVAGSVQEVTPEPLVVKM